jgi:hypothetical protein
MNSLDAEGRTANPQLCPIGHLKYTPASWNRPISPETYAARKQSEVLTFQMWHPASARAPLLPSSDSHGPEVGPMYSSSWNSYQRGSEWPRAINLSVNLALSTRFACVKWGFSPFWRRCEVYSCEEDEHIVECIVWRLDHFRTNEAGPKLQVTSYSVEPRTQDDECVGTSDVTDSSDNVSLVGNSSSCSICDTKSQAKSRIDTPIGVSSTAGKLELSLCHWRRRDNHLNLKSGIMQAYILPLIYW